MFDKLLPETKAEICTHFEHGLTQKEIAIKFNISQSTVSKTIKNHRIRGFYARKKGSGRKKILSVQDMKFLEAKVDSKPKIGSNKLKSTLAQVKSVEVSARTIRRSLCEINLNGRVACSKPLLTDINVNKRLEHSQTWIDYANEDWDRIIWSDETKINLIGSDGRTYVRRRPGTRYKSKYLKSTAKHGGGCVMVWGCFSSKGVGEITFINDIMNADGYCRILDTCLFKSAKDLKIPDFIFQQDNDPKHTSGLVKE